MTGLQQETIASTCLDVQLVSKTHILQLAFCLCPCSSLLHFLTSCSKMLVWVEAGCPLVDIHMALTMYANDQQLHANKGSCRAEAFDRVSGETSGCPPRSS